MPLIEALKTKKININQIISLVILIVASLVAINIYKRQNEKIAQVIQLQDEQTKKNDILLRIGNLKKRIELYKEKISPKDSREIINTLTELARSAGAKIISLKPQEGLFRGGGGATEVYNKVFFNLTIQVEGYHQLGRFISRLENNPMLFIVESVQVSGLTSHPELTAKPEKLQIELIISKLFFK